MVKVAAATLALIGGLAAAAEAAVLADWTFGDDGAAYSSGNYVDAAAGYGANYNLVTPVNPSKEHNGITSMDLVRRRGDIATWNYANGARYRDIVTNAQFGLTGPATYWGAYASDGKTAAPGSDSSNDILTTRNVNALSNADLNGGFTLEAIYRPFASSDVRSPINASGTFVNGERITLLSIEAYVEFGVYDADSTAGVDPRYYFFTNGTFGSNVLTAPFNASKFTDDPSAFEHLVATYESTGANVGTIKLYADGQLLNTATGVTLRNIDTGNTTDPLTGPHVYGKQVIGVGGHLTPAGGYAAGAFIDEVRISNGSPDVTQFIIPIPEPATIGLAAVGGAMLACRRRR